VIFYFFFSLPFKLLNEYQLFPNLLLSSWNLSIGSPLMNTSTVTWIPWWNFKTLGH